MRNNIWLNSKLDYVWQSIFPELEKKNIVKIRFKGSWKNKFGHIKLLKDKSSEICINGLFANEVVPEYIIDITIAHELVHYMHGFNSPYEKKFTHPHQGRIVDKELKKRGLHNLLKQERHFVKKQWLEFYKEMKNKF